jgi:hypothetical protein
MLTMVGVFCAGYVLGTRAGRERYAQIVAAARNAAQKLEVYGAGGSFTKARTPQRTTGTSDT